MWWNTRMFIWNLVKSLDVYMGFDDKPLFLCEMQWNTCSFTRTLMKRQSGYATCDENTELSAGPCENTAFSYELWWKQNRYVYLTICGSPYVFTETYEKQHCMFIGTTSSYEIRWKHHMFLFVYEVWRTPVFAYASWWSTCIYMWNLMKIQCFVCECQLLKTLLLRVKFDEQSSMFMWNPMETQEVYVKSDEHTWVFICNLMKTLCAYMHADEHPHSVGEVWWNTCMCIRNLVKHQ